MSNATYSIQELSDQSGLPRRTIHFYIQQGILPPPAGAGLAATYDENHLTRLRLVPLLRQQGLRLDAIRLRLNQLPPVELPSLLQNLSAGPAQPALSPHPAHRLPPSQPCLRYALPAGIQLIAPADLTPANLTRLEQLLHAARQIFNNENQNN